MEFRRKARTWAGTWLFPPIFSEDGKVIAAIGIVDLLSVLEMQEIIRTMVNNSPAVVFLWRNKEKWPSEFVSENVVQFGYTVEDFISGRVLYGNIIHPDDLKRIEDSLEQRILKGGVDFNVEYRIFTKAGDLRWVNERAFIQRNGEAAHLQYFTNWIRKSSSFIPISKYFSVKCLKS